MSRFSRVLIAALALLAICAPIAYAEYVETGGVSSLTHQSVVLTGIVELDSNEWTDYAFAYVPKSQSWSQAKLTPKVRLAAGNGRVPVSAQVSGLKDATEYKYAVARWEPDNDYDAGVERYFTTLKAPVASPGSTSATPPPPALGETVVAEVSAGTVLVKEKGSSEFQPLESAESIPVNSTLDTTDGTVVIETALPGGESQSGTFRGGAFQVRQSRRGGGMTEIALRGGDFSSCTARSKRRGAVTFRRKGPKRQLWASDKGGRFKTSSKGSVATVRGTSWYTADRCDGTLTKVSEGAVMVRERGTGRHKLLKAGQSFLARFPR